MYIDVVMYLLHSKYILSPDIRDTILNELYLFLFLLTQLVGSFGSLDFKDVVCNPDKLEEYIILSDKNNRYIVNKYSVSNSLCRIEDDKISDITNELIRQLDVPNIIRLVRTVKRVFKDLPVKNQKGVL